MVSFCLPSDTLLQHLPSYLGFSYLGCGVSLHGYSSKAQLLLLTLDEGYLLMAAPPDLERGATTPQNASGSSVQLLSHIHNWVLFLLWLHPFTLSGVISPLISSSILGTYRPGQFPFQYPIILPFHTVHGVLKARILKWLAIPFSSGPYSVRPLHHDPPVLGGPTRHGLVSLS